MTTPIPGPPGVPVLGNVFDVNSNNLWSSFNALSEKFGEIFKITIFGHSIVFVCGAALAEEICDEKRFRKFVGGPIVEIRAAVHDALFTAYDDEKSWYTAHRIIAPTLSPEAVAGRFQEMRGIMAELLTLWKGLEGDKNTILPLRDLNRLNLEVNTETLFGKRLNCLETDHPMLEAMETSTSEAMKRPFRPGVLNWLLYSRKFKASIKTMRSYAADLVQHRKENPAEDREGDLLSVLLNGKDPETGVALTESQVIDEIVSMPIGSSTTPCAIASTIYYLLQNPDVVTKAREELDAVVGPGEVQLEHLSRLPYCTGIVRETLRLSSAAPGFNIEPRPREDPADKSPILLAGGKYQIPYNQAMILLLYPVNRDPTVFEEPLAFKPERMTGEAFDNLPSGTKKWFGNGRRVCIGQHWAFQFVLLFTCMAIKEVDFEAVDPEYKPSVDGWFNIRLVDFKVAVKPRAA